MGLPYLRAMMKALRALVASVAVATLALASVACGDRASGAEATGAAPAGKPLLARPVAQLAQADLEGAIAGLGYKHSGTTSNQGKTTSNVMVSGTRPGADGKPITLTVSLFTVVPEARERELTRLKGEGAAKEDGDKILAVKVWPKDAEDPAAVLKKLTGG